MAKNEADCSGKMCSILRPKMYALFSVMYTENVLGEDCSMEGLIGFLRDTTILNKL